MNTKRRPIEVLNSYSQQVMQSFARLQRLGELIQSGTLEEIAQNEELRLRELKALEDEKPIVSEIMNKKTNSLRMTFESSQIELSRKAQLLRSQMLERSSQTVLANLKFSFSTTKKFPVSKFRLRDLVVYFRKLKDPYLVLLVPKFETRATGAEGALVRCTPLRGPARRPSVLIEEKVSDPTKLDYEDFSESISFTIHLLNTKSCLVIKFQLKAKKAFGLTEPAMSGTEVSLDHEVSVVDLDIHGLFESSRGFKSSKLPKKFQIESSPVASASFEKLLSENEAFSLDLPLSESPLCNQLALGLKEKLASNLLLGSNPQYLIVKLLDYGLKFISLPISEEKAFCAFCKRIVVMEDGKPIFPYIQKGNGFIHPKCVEEVDPV